MIENLILDKHMCMHCVPGYLMMGVLKMLIVRFR